MEISLYKRFRYISLSWLVFLCPFSKNNLIQIGSVVNVMHIKFCFILVHGFGCYYIAGSGEKLESLCRNPCGKSWCKILISFLTVSSIRVCLQQSKPHSLTVTINSNASPQSAGSSPRHFLQSCNKLQFCYRLRTVTVPYLSVSFRSVFKRLFKTSSHCLSQSLVSNKNSSDAKSSLIFLTLACLCLSK